MQLTISGYSTAMFSTWYFIEEYGLLFDAGDGLIASLLQKSRKVNHVFISHADRDHLTGLLQFNQLNARPGFPIVYYPKDSASFPALAEFSKRFDPQVSDTVWTPVMEGEEITVAKDLLVKPLRNEHVAAAAGVVKSLSYQLIEVRKKLKPELAHLSGEELRVLSQREGRDFLSTEMRTILLSYSGDTPITDGARWDGSNVLIHEATFLDDEVKDRGYGNKHSTLDEVMEMVSGIRIGGLILGHFSSRYAAEDIKAAVRAACERYAINVPVRLVLPGETVRDVLGGEAVNG